MITGILSAFPHGKFFDSVIFDLQAIADTPVHLDFVAEEIHLPQVHAMNCLKDVFSDTRFGLSVERHAQETLSIAVSCLDAKM